MRRAKFIYRTVPGGCVLGQETTPKNSRGETRFGSEENSGNLLRARRGPRVAGREMHACLLLFKEACLLLLLCLFQQYAPTNQPINPSTIQP